MRISNRGRIRVLVVDDSVLVRKTITELISKDPGMEVVATAGHGREALEIVERLRPDVVSLDLNMPVMDGMTCLGHLIRDYKQRVVILSTLARKNSFATFKALALGAIDFVTKPGAGEYLGGLDELGKELITKIRTAASVRSEKIGRRQAPPAKFQEKPGSPIERHAVPNSRTSVVSIGARLRGVVGIGGSTGGTVALEALMQHIPAFLPVSLVIVQHIPTGFSKHFARYLDSIGRFTVREAVDGIVLKSHCAYLAPGGPHLRVQNTAGGLVLRTDESTPANSGFRPSINILFYSLATAERHRAVGILLSGMGSDGVSGLTAIHRLGGRTLVQDSVTSVVFDMGARAIKTGNVDEVLPPEGLAGAVYRAMKGSDPDLLRANGAT